MSTTSFSSNNISEVIINGQQIFNIKISAENTENIVVKSISDGEYGNEFSVVSEVKGDQLIIALKRAVLYDTPDDKRNAHKVISAELDIKMPDNLRLSVISDVGSVNANGIFKTLHLNLSQGNCNIEAIAEEANIKTTDGNIYIETKNALIETDSKSGLVDIPNNMFGFNLWRLSTVSGNITVKQTK